jgi:hypothetical protein
MRGMNPERGHPLHEFRRLQVGRFHVFRLLDMNGMALLIYRLFENRGPFHWSAVLSLMGLTVGTAPLLPGYRRGRNWPGLRAARVWRAL